MLPPQDLDAERAVLGALLFSAEAREAVIGRLGAHEFYADAHQRIAAAVYQLADAGHGVDVVTLADELTRRGELADIGGPRVLAEVLEGVPHTANASFYADIVREKFKLRSIREAFSAGLHDLHDSNATASEILDRTSAMIGNLQEIGTGEATQSIRDVLLAGFDAMMQGQSAPAVGSGYAELDKILLGGLRNGSLTLLAARPSVGKTALAVNMLLRIAANESREEGHRQCLFFSLEQPAVDVSERMLSTASKVAMSTLRQPSLLSEAEHDDVLRTSTKISELPIMIDDSSDITVSKMLAIARRVKRRYGLLIVFVDYLQLLTPSDRRVPREQQVTQLSRDLKNMARQLKVPVVCLAQLNREVDKREDRKPQMAHLRESGSLEADSDVIAMLWRPADASKPVQKDDGSGRNYEGSDVVLLVEKQRNGPTGRVPLFWHKETVAFHDSSRADESGNYQRAMSWSDAQGDRF